MKDEKTKSKPIAGFRWLFTAWAVTSLFCVCDIIWADREAPSREIVEQQMELDMKEESTGALVWLKQSIHGPSGTTYRYVVETDCPQWDYEDRYVANEPLDWAVDSTSAVEVIVYDARVRIDGTVYADGQYYTVPMLGLSSEDMPLDQWKDLLADRAYQAYASRMSRPIVKKSLMSVFGAVTVLLVIYMLWALCMAAKRRDSIPAASRTPKKYTVVLLFNEDLSKILLQTKASTAFAGMLNGVGGKVEPDESPMQGALREMTEELSISKAGLDEHMDRFDWLGTLTLPENCDERFPDNYPELWFFAGVLSDESIVQTPVGGLEEVSWYRLGSAGMPITDRELAGDGDLEYFIERALRRLRDDEGCGAEPAEYVQRHHG